LKKKKTHYYNIRFLDFSGE